MSDLVPGAIVAWEGDSRWDERIGLFVSFGSDNEGCIVKVKDKDSLKLKNILIKQKVYSLPAAIWEDILNALWRDEHSDESTNAQDMAIKLMEELVRDRRSA